MAGAFSVSLVILWSYRIIIKLSARILLLTTIAANQANRNWLLYDLFHGVLVDPTAKSLHLTAKSLHLTAKSLHLTAKSLHLTAKSLHLTAKSLHLTAKYLINSIV
jgi:hypothetical protein